MADAIDHEAAHAERVALEARRVQVEYLCAALRGCAPEDAAQIVCAWLESRAAPPRLDPFGELREDAAYWADVAGPHELEAYVAAGLRRIERTAFGERARKRLLVALWETMPEDWRRDFVRRVDPEGRFYRPGAAA
jgi:hypothetical protein